MDEFLYCYKSSEISQSSGFYQFLERGSICRLVRSLPTSDRRWKTKFFFVSRFWARNPIEVGKDPFPPYTGEMGHLRPEDMLISHPLFYFFYHIHLFFLFSFFFFYSCETSCFVQIPFGPH